MSDCIRTATFFPRFVESKDDEELDRRSGYDEEEEGGRRSIVSTFSSDGLSFAVSQPLYPIITTADKMNVTERTGLITLYRYNDERASLRNDYDSNDDGWLSVGCIQDDNRREGILFGYSLSLSGDGRTVAVGAPLKHSNDVERSRSVTIYLILDENDREETKTKDDEDVNEEEGCKTATNRS